jgi:hypothetical protein
MGFTVKGLQCKNKVQKGSYCNKHQKSSDAMMSYLNILPLDLTIELLSLETYRELIWLLHRIPQFEKISTSPELNIRLSKKILNKYSIDKGLKEALYDPGSQNVSLYSKYLEHVCEILSTDSKDYYIISLAISKRHLPTIKYMTSKTDDILVYGRWLGDAIRCFKSDNYNMEKDEVINFILNKIIENIDKVPVDTAVTLIEQLLILIKTLDKVILTLLRKVEPLTIDNLNDCLSFSSGCDISVIKYLIEEGATSLDVVLYNSITANNYNTAKYLLDRIAQSKNKFLLDVLTRCIELAIQTDNCQIVMHIMSRYYDKLNRDIINKMIQVANYHSKYLIGHYLQSRL